MIMDVYIAYSVMACLWFFGVGPCLFSDRSTGYKDDLFATFIITIFVLSAVAGLCAILWSFDVILGSL